MTGETGAGKSIIIDSVNFVLGDRSSKDVIRTGMEKTYVEAIFESIKSTEFENLLSENGISSDEGVLVLSRELNLSGRTVCRVNGRTMTVAFLKLLGKYLIDIHGQHEHQSLIDEENHIDILDLFGGEKICELKSLVHNKYLTVQDIMKKLDSLTGDDRERQRKLDLLDYQVKEICDADLRVGEEEELVKKRTILNNSGKLFSVLSGSYERLYESYDNQDSVFDIMGSLLSEFQA
jgi:DNA repair protein RecN (Recombination protein N)